MTSRPSQLSAALLIALTGLLGLAACGSAPPAPPRAELPRVERAEEALDDLTGIWWSGAEDGGRVRMVGERRGRSVDVRIQGFSTDGTQVSEHHTWTWDPELGAYRIIFSTGAGGERRLTGRLLPNAGISLEIPRSATRVDRNVFYSPAPDRLHIRQELVDEAGKVHERTRVFTRARPPIKGPLTSTLPDVAQLALVKMGMLPEIRYAAGATAVPSSAKAALARTARLLRVYPEVTLTVDGFDDLRGESDESMSISLARAADVAAELEEDGVPAAQLTIVAHGEELPVCTEESAQCDTRNRRVELRFGGLRELEPAE